MFKTAWIKFLSRFLLCKRCNSTWSYPFETRSYKITHTQLDYLKGLKQFYHLPSIPNTRLFARFTNCRNNLYPFDLSIYRCTSLQVNYADNIPQNMFSLSGVIEWLENIDTPYLKFFEAFEISKIKSCIRFCAL